MSISVFSTYTPLSLKLYQPNKTRLILRCLGLIFKNKFFFASSKYSNLFFKLLRRHTFLKQVVFGKCLAMFSRVLQRLLWRVSVTGGAEGVGRSAHMQMWWETRPLDGPEDPGFTPLGRGEQIWDGAKNSTASLSRIEDN